MPVAPDPAEIFERAVEEGQRRLDQSTVELVSTSVIAGFTIVFGIVALGIVHAKVAAVSPELARIAGALAFAPGLVFLIVGRAELFNENFFDPVATAVDNDDSWMIGPILRLWVVTFLFNMIGGVVLVAVMSIQGTLPHGTGHTLKAFAEEIAKRGPAAGFAKAFVGGALVTLGSFMFEAVDSVRSRITVAFFIGFLLTLGPFDHVVVTLLHVVIGVLYGAHVGLVAFAAIAAVVTVGNLVGGLGLVTLTHIGQALGAEESGG